MMKAHIFSTLVLFRKMIKCMIGFFIFFLVGCSTTGEKTEEMESALYMDELVRDNSNSGKKDFKDDFAINYHFSEAEVVVQIIPSEKYILNESPYSWDEKVTWCNKNEYHYKQTGNYYIYISTLSDGIKRKSILVDFEMKRVYVNE